MLGSTEMERFANWIIQHRCAGWLFFAALSGAAAIGLSRLRFDDSLRDVFRREENLTKLENQFLLSENAFVILVRGDALFSRKVVEQLREFDFSLREMDGISRVVSIFDARSPRETEGYHPPLMPGSDSPRAAFDLAEAEARIDPLVSGNLLSASGKVLLFFAIPKTKTDRVEELSPIQRALAKNAATLAAASGLEVKVGGIPTLRTRIVLSTRREQLIFTLGGALLGLLVAWIIFRRTAVLLLLFPVPVVAAAWALGAMGLVGESINPLNNMISVLVTVIALSDSIHLIFAVRRRSREGDTPSLATVRGLSEVGPACLLTSLTTAVSFGSLAFSGNSLVARFGLSCAAATLLAFLAVILFIPLVASTRMGNYISPLSHRHELSQWTGFTWISRFILRFRWQVVAAGVVITLVALLLCLRLNSDYRYRENLDSDSEEWKIAEVMDREFGGSQPFYVIVASPTGQVIDPKQTLAILREVQSVMTKSERTGRAVSVLNLIDAMGLKNRTDPLNTLKTEFPEEVLNAFYNRDKESFLVVAPLQDSGSSTLLPIITKIEKRLAGIESRHPGYHISSEGLAANSVRASRTMIHELITGIFTAALVIVVLIGLFLRSLELIFHSILPNLLPMSLIGAGLVLFHRPLQYISALTLTICLGIAVDDTIHFLFRFQSYRKKGVDLDCSIQNTIQSIGAALVTSTAILLAGLALLQTSSLATVRTFSWLTIAALSAALLADLFLLPASLSVAGKRQSTSSDNSGEQS